jgi:hypothetical protein
VPRKATHKPILVVLLSASACVSTELSSTAHDPANPQAQSPPLPGASSALRPGFEPFAAYGIKGSGDVAGHEHGSQSERGGHSEHGSQSDGGGQSLHDDHSDHGATQVRGAHGATRASGDGGAGEDAGLRPKPQSSIVYVCPMHPEVRRSAPGRCPKCGMKLEPRRKDGAR